MDKVSEGLEAYMHVIDILDDEQGRQTKDEASRHPAKDHEV